MENSGGGLIEEWKYEDKGTYQSYKRNRHA